MWKSTDTCSVTDKDKMPFVAGYTHSFYSRDDVPYYEGNYEYSDGTSTPAGVYFDGSTTSGYQYGTFYGKYNYNASVSQTTGIPGGTFYVNARPTQINLNSAGYIKRGTREYALQFQGANNGQYNTTYPSPNRVTVTMGSDGAPNYDSLAAHGGWGDEWTIEMWIWPKDDTWALEPNKHQVLFDGRSNASGGGDNPVILLRADGTIRMGSGGQGGSIIHSTYPLESSTGAVSFYDYTTSGSWQHLAVTKRAGTGANNIGIFVDGIEVGGGIANSTVNEGFNDWDTYTYYIGDDYFGENGNGRRGYTGLIQNVRTSKGNKYPTNFSGNLPDLHNT